MTASFHDDGYSGSASSRASVSSFTDADSNLCSGFENSWQFAWSGDISPGISPNFGDAWIPSLFGEFAGNSFKEVRSLGLSCIVLFIVVLSHRLCISRGSH